MIRMTRIKIKEKRWDKSFEEEIYKEWLKNGIYRFNEKTKKPVFSIDTPPPYVNTPIHIGHATTYSLMDMFARFKRMMGYEVLFPLGLDRNGLPIEMAAEKKFNVRLSEVGRERFLEMCKKILEQTSSKSIEYFLKLGISFNSWERGSKIGDMYYTDSEEYRKLTQETFIDLWNMGLIHEDERINNYCPGCQTTIADAEVEYAELPTTFNYVKFKVKETGEDLIIGTTRPELIATCAMVIFNPNDKKYKHLEGKTAITPIFNKEVPIKSHPMAKMEKGTGLVMMCSMGDLSDIRFFREMNLKPVIAINRDGTMNENAGFLKGLKVREAREKMIEELRKRGLLVKQTKIVHRTPICERSKHEIEFIAMPEFYLEQVKFKNKLREIAKKINFYSNKSRQILLDWIDSINIDWPISRRRYYGTEIPLWYCKKCKKIIVPPKGRYYRPWKEDPPIKECPDCGSKEFIGETRVFDTWFDSSNTPLYILGYSQNPEFFKKHFPCTLRPQGKEIIRTWLYYTLLKGYLLTKESVFKDVWINYHILDEKGKKMSKSLGNVIDPGEILEKYGAEPFRFWIAMEGDLTKIDFRFSLEKIEGESKFLTKLWNIARFVSQFEYKKSEKLIETDKWIINELNKIISYTRKRYEKYDFHRPTVKLRNFIWEIFASHYIELVKNRAYNEDSKFTVEEQKSALYTLNYVLDTVLKLLAPVIPFITYKLYKDLRGKNIHKEDFPEVNEKFAKLKTHFRTDDIVELNSTIWKFKKDKGLSLRSEIKKITIPEKFKSIEKDLKVTHNIKEINYGNRIKIES